MSPCIVSSGLEDKKSQFADLGKAAIPAEFRVSRIRLKSRASDHESWNWEWVDSPAAQRLSWKTENEGDKEEIYSVKEIDK